MKNESLKSNIRMTWKYVKRSKFNLILYGVIIIIEAIIATIIPLLSAKVILNMTNGVIEQLILAALAVFFINILCYLLSYFKGFFYQKVYKRTLMDMQKDLTREILKLEIEEINKNSSGLFIDRLNNDTADMASLFMQYTFYLTYIITNVGVLVTIYILNKYLFVYAIFTALVSFAIKKISINKQYEIAKKLRIIAESKTGLTGEVVRGIMDIKVLNAEDTILNQTSNKIEETTKEEVNIMNIKRFYTFLENNVGNITNFIFILLGCFLYSKNLLSIAAFVIIYNYRGRIKNLLNGVAQILEYNKKFNLASGRVYEVIGDERFKKEKFGTTSIPKLNGNIEFKNVSFGYDRIKVLKDISFEVKEKEKVAFVGKSGAGKTTIFNLITKLYDVDKGEILLDGHNINDLTCSTIRDNMSIITQSPYIFNFSIKDNLLLAKENATMKEIREACKMACIDDYIMSLPEKYNTVVGENGVTLSGGQKQRLAIARALLVKSEIILFDEATSALDNETQRNIKKAINNLNGKYTVLIIAHRLSTVIDSDKIFVINDGKVIDSGSHKELLERCEFYKELYKSDLEK